MKHGDSITQGQPIEKNSSQKSIIFVVSKGAFFEPSFNFIPKKRLSLLIKLGLFSLSASTNIDSAIIYYLPINSTFTHHISPDNIDVKKEPFIIQDTFTLKHLNNILQDSLFALPIKKDSDNVDTRIVVRCYKRGIVIKEIIVGDDNGISLIDGSPVIISNIDVVLRFIYSMSFSALFGKAENVLQNRKKENYN